MKDYLKPFASVAIYDAWKSSNDYIEPNVSLIGSETVEYNPFINYANMYLTFEALEDTTFTFTGSRLYYSIDNGDTWTTLAANTSTPTIKAGNKILWKQTGLTRDTYPYGVGPFSSTGQFNVSGNIMSLYYGDNFADKTDLTGKNYAFKNLFESCSKLVNAKNLILPATTLANSCYSDMFWYCTSLVTAPKLPATILAEQCYESMFRDCESLTATPELPATTLANYCYHYMFKGCTALTTAPELPATTLATSCYNNMFSGCTSLTTAPELPATTLAQQCYSTMFDGCTELTTAPELPATTLAYGCYQFMFNGCTSLEATPELPVTTLAENCYNSMFRGCTVLTTAPELPATALTNNCYNSMFQNCTLLTTAPELPATTLATGCYAAMFQGCTSLNYIKCLSTDISAMNCTLNWIQNVATNGTFVKNTSMSSWTTGDSGIPSGWTVQDAA